MHLLVVGVSHRTAPMAVLERAAVNADDAPELLDELLGQENIAEVLVLSTCNRAEAHTVVECFHGGLADVSAVLSGHAGLPRGLSGASATDLTEYQFVHYAGAAVEHLFSVAALLCVMAVAEAP